MTRPVQKVEVEIFGERYRLWADTPPGHIEAVARVVETRFRSLLHSRPELSPGRAEALVAFGLADELLTHRAKTDENRDLLDRLDALINLVIKEGHDDTQN